MNTSNFANTGANKMKHHIIPAPPKMDTSDQGFFLDHHNRPMPIIMVSGRSSIISPVFLLFLELIFRDLQGLQIERFETFKERL